MTDHDERRRDTDTISHAFSVRTDMKRNVFRLRGTESFRFQIEVGW